MIPNAKPRLLVLTSTFPRWRDDPEPGFVHDLCKRMTEEFEVHVVCPHAPGARNEDELDGVQVHRFHYAPARLETLVQGGGILNNLIHKPWKGILLPMFFLAHAVATWRLVRQLGPICIHAHWIIPQGLVYVGVQQFLRDPPPFLLTSHGGDLFSLRGRLFEQLKRAVVQRAAAITVVSRAMISEAIRLGADPAQVHVIPMGVNFEGLFTPGPAEARQPGEILFVGRLVEKKGLRYLIEAMPAVIAEMPYARLKIVGQGPEEANLRALSENMGIKAHVEFLGAKPQMELPGFYQRASLFVAPFVEAENGDREGLGLVTVEAIACGCPVIIGDMPVLDEIFNPEEADLRVYPRQTEKLAERIVGSMKHPNLAVARVLEIRKRLDNRLGWESIAEGYQQLLKTLPSRASRHGPPPCPPKTNKQV